MKKRINLTVEDKVLQKAKQYARDSDQSLSEMVENILREKTAGYNLQNEIRWLDEFHKKFLPPVSEIPDDRELEIIRKNHLNKKYQ